MHSQGGIYGESFNDQNLFVRSSRPYIPNARLQAHEADVIDLAWNRNDKFLASCSLDNSIIIWNSSNKFEKVNVLKGHTNFVKGVTWDPVGSYLASQSTDNTVRVWNTVDWTMETIIEGPFSNSSNNGHVMRIGWSPDGTYIIAGGAINNGGPTAQVISRKWQLGFDLAWGFKLHVLL